MTTRYAIDLETACTVHGCSHQGKSLCPNNHSLSPWHSRITVAATVSNGTRRVFRGPTLVEDMRAMFEAAGDYEVVGHNFKFDWLHLAVHGWQIPLERWVGDSQLAAYVSTEKIPEHWLAEYEARRKQLGPHHRKAGKHSLKTLAPFHLGIEPFWEQADHDSDEYVIKDTAYTLALVDKLEGRLKELGQFDFYKTKQLEWAKLLVRAELRGIQLDMPALLAMEQEQTEKATKLKAALDDQWQAAHVAYTRMQEAETNARYAAQRPRRDREERRQKAIAAIPFGVDYDSPLQMQWLLRDYLGYNITNLEGKDSTEAEVLERLAHEGHTDVGTYLEWRQTNKILTAFLPTYKELAVKDANVDDGSSVALHPIFNPDSTRTGRTSCERPNFQQVPQALRPLSKARPGYKLVGFDQAAIEARLIALYSSDPVLYEIIKEGISLHDYNTKVFFGLGEEVSLSSIKKSYAKERAAAKGIGFALFYNAGARRIRITFAENGYHLSEQECREIHRRFKHSFKTAYEYGMQVVRYMERGEVLSNLLDRPLRIEDPDDAYMKAFNRLIQSSASDLLLEGALRADAALKAAGIQAHPLLFVHDYLGMEVEEGRAEEAAKIIERELTNFELVNAHGRIALEVEGGITDRWEK